MNIYEKVCQTCKYWGTRETRNGQPDNFKICALSSPEGSWHDEEDVNFPMIAPYDSGYVLTDVQTRGDFGCILHKAKL